MRFVLAAILAVAMLMGVNASLCPPTPVLGKVVDECDDEPLKGVVVELGEDSDTTNVFGLYVVKGYGYGNRELKASKEGYEDWEKTIKVNCGMPIIKDITLERTNGCEDEPRCGDETCNGEETCESCEQDCGICEEPIPPPEEHKSHPPCDHCFVLGGLANWYQEIMYGYWYRYAEKCGLDYDRHEPVQNLRWRCENVLKP